uniref:remodeling and spacing factor 1-like isoform X1 n=2 Tax=Myxine glutinosa TaxID=7769 RepID=UPI00358E390C
MDGVVALPDFAVICSFLQRYGRILDMPDINLAQLESAIDEKERVPQQLIDLHVKLLRKLGRTVSSERWEKHLLRICQDHHQSWALELETLGYVKSSSKLKIGLLKFLCECQFDDNIRFKSVVNEEEADDMRLQPLGRDACGFMYWLQRDRDLNLRLYAEEQDDYTTWRLVSRSRDQLAELLQLLRAQLEVCELSKEAGGSGGNEVIDEGEGAQSRQVDSRCSSPAHPHGDASSGGDDSAMDIPQQVQEPKKEDNSKKSKKEEEEEVKKVEGICDIEIKKESDKNEDMKFKSEEKKVKVILPVSLEIDSSSAPSVTDISVKVEVKSISSMAFLEKTLPPPLSCIEEDGKNLERSGVVESASGGCLSTHAAKQAKLPMKKRDLKCMPWSSMPSLPSASCAEPRDGVEKATLGNEVYSISAAVLQNDTANQYGNLTTVAEQEYRLPLLDATILSRDKASIAKETCISKSDMRCEKPGGVLACGNNVALEGCALELAKESVTGKEGECAGEREPPFGRLSAPDVHTAVSLSLKSEIKELEAKVYLDSMERKVGVKDPVKDFEVSTRENDVEKLEKDLKGQKSRLNSEVLRRDGEMNVAFPKKTLPVGNGHPESKISEKTQSNGKELEVDKMRSTVLRWSNGGNNCGELDIGQNVVDEKHIGLDWQANGYSVTPEAGCLEAVPAQQVITGLTNGGEAVTHERGHRIVKELDNQSAENQAMVSDPKSSSTDDQPIVVSPDLEKQVMKESEQVAYDLTLKYDRLQMGTEKVLPPKGVKRKASVAEDVLKGHSAACKTGMDEKEILGERGLEEKSKKDDCCLDTERGSEDSDGCKNVLLVEKTGKPKYGRKVGNLCCRIELKDQREGVGIEAEIKNSVNLARIQQKEALEEITFSDSFQQSKLENKLIKENNLSGDASCSPKKVEDCISRQQEEVLQTDMEGNAEGKVMMGVRVENKVGKVQEQIVRWDHSETGKERGKILGAEERRVLQKDQGKIEKQGSNKELAIVGKAKIMNKVKIAQNKCFEGTKDGEDFLSETERVLGSKEGKAEKVIDGDVQPGRKVVDEACDEHRDDVNNVSCSAGDVEKRSVTHSEEEQGLEKCTKGNEAEKHFMIVTEGMKGGNSTPKCIIRHVMEKCSVVDKDEDKTEVKASKQKSEEATFVESKADDHSGIDEGGSIKNEESHLAESMMEERNRNEEREHSLTMPKEKENNDSLPLEMRDETLHENILDNGSKKRKQNDTDHEKQLRENCEKLVDTAGELLNEGKQKKLATSQAVSVEGKEDFDGIRVGLRWNLRRSTRTARPTEKAAAAAQQSQRRKRSTPGDVHESLSEGKRLVKKVCKRPAKAQKKSWGKKRKYNSGKSRWRRKRDFWSDSGSDEEEEDEDDFYHESEEREDEAEKEDEHEEEEEEEQEEEDEDNEEVDEAESDEKDGESLKAKDGLGEEEAEKEEQPPIEDDPCKKCNLSNHPELILLCDTCDSGYHTACLHPALMLIPDGEWFCPPCQHQKLCERLQDELTKLDALLKKRERAERRKEKFVHTAASLEYLITAEKAQEEEEKQEEEEIMEAEVVEEGNEADAEVISLDVVQKLKKAESGQDGEHKEQENGGEVVVTEGDLELQTERRSGRQRRAISYRYVEFDEAIHEAIQDAMGGLQGAGRGKDIENFSAYGRHSTTHTPRRGKDMSTILASGEESIKQLGCTAEGEGEGEGVEGQGGEEWGKGMLGNVVKRRKHKRRLNALESESSLEDNSDDEEFCFNPSGSDAEDLEVSDEEEESEYRCSSPAPSGASSDAGEYSGKAASRARARANASRARRLRRRRIAKKVSEEEEEESEASDCSGEVVDFHRRCSRRAATRTVNYREDSEDSATAASTVWGVHRQKVMGGPGRQLAWSWGSEESYQSDSGSEGQPPRKRLHRINKDDDNDDEEEEEEEVVGAERRARGNGEQLDVTPHHSPSCPTTVRKFRQRLLSSDDDCGDGDGTNTDSSSNQSSLGYDLGMVRARSNGPLPDVKASGHAGGSPKKPGLQPNVGTGGQPPLLCAAASLVEGAGEEEEEDDLLGVTDLVEYVCNSRV